MQIDINNCELMLEALEFQLSNLSHFKLRLVCKDINNYIDHQDAACWSELSAGKGQHDHY